MKVINEELFFCYSWEDLADVQRMISEFSHELDVEIVTPLETDNITEVSEKFQAKIANAEVFVLFISEAARQNNFVKQCATLAKNLNKNVISIEIGRLSLLSSMPSEFRFRTDRFIYRDEDSRAKLFAQLKAALGVSVCGGDSYGRLYHVVTDSDAVVIRYGEKLGTAYKDSDFQIRLAKGYQMLEFRSIEDDGISVSQDFEVNSNEGEDFIKVSIKDRLNERKAQLNREKEREENELREREIRKEYEEKRIRIEEEHKNELLKQQIEYDNQNKTETVVDYYNSGIGESNNKKGIKRPGCLISVAVVLGIAFPWTLIITIPLVIYLLSKKK